LTKFEVSTKKGLQNAVRQIEDYIRLQASLSGAPALPSMHGWPISPDFAMLLVTLIKSENYTAIVEFGSGTSTVLMAQTVLQLKNSKPKRPIPQLIAFEHLEKYHEKTRADLSLSGVPENIVNVCHSTLVPFQDSTGSYSYYNCENDLSALAAQIKNQSTPAKILVVIDGPPGSTNKHARYPALPVVLEHFPRANIHFLLDDYIRDEEKQIAEIWKTQLKAQDKKFNETVYDFEKEALLINVMGEEKQIKPQMNKGV